MLGPKLEQIENHDYPTERVESYVGDVRTVHEELCEPGTAIHIARRIWRENQPLDRVCVVNERTGFTRDIISKG